MLLTSRFRKLPDFIIVGVQKGGTTSLFNDLKKHPNIKLNNNKEVHFFDRNYAKGIYWYQSWFPLKNDERITGEATPSYIFYPNVIKRIHKHLPDIKLIVLLRDPVDRAYSHYQMEKRKFRENLSFEEAIKHEQLNFTSLYNKVLKEDEYIANNELINKSYLRRGVYVEQIKNLFSYYDKSKIMIIESKNFKENKLIILNEICDFLAIEHFKSKVSLKNKNVHDFPRIDNKTKEVLKNYFSNYNKDLFKLINRKFEW